MYLVYGMYGKGAATKNSSPAKMPCIQSPNFSIMRSTKSIKKTLWKPLLHLAKLCGLVSDSHAIPKKADGICLAQVMGGVSVEAVLVALFFLPAVILQYDSIGVDYANLLTHLRSVV